jgi:hypothetical protein
VQEIMAKIAANQDRSQEMRSAFVYRQDLLLRFLRGNGKTAREEEREYNVTPTANGSDTSARSRYPCETAAFSARKSKPRSFSMSRCRSKSR